MYTSTRMNIERKRAEYKKYTDDEEEGSVGAKGSGVERKSESEAISHQQNFFCLSSLSQPSCVTKNKKKLLK